MIDVNLKALIKKSLRVYNGALEHHEKEMRILMAGLDNSGKTTIVLKLNGEDTSVISPTLGFNIKTFVLNLDAMDKTRHRRSVAAERVDGLLEGFDWLVQDIASRIYVLD